jgi:DNA polymerase-3 subunit delta
MARAAAPSASSTSTTPSDPVCLIHGDDDFAVKQRARQIHQQWSAELGGMDHEVIDAQVANSGEALRSLNRLREALQTLPFFGTGKAVWLQNCSFLGDDRTAASQAVTEALGELAQELKEFSWQGVRLLVSAGKVDKRKTFYKTLEKLGRVEAFAAWSLDDKDWTSQAETAARRLIKARKKEMRDEPLAELIQRVGPHREQLANEIEKLCLYIGDRAEVELTDVVATVTRSKQARAFAVGEALGDRDLPRLLRTLDEELWEIRSDKRKSEIGLLYGLITKTRSLIFLKEMIRENWVRPDADYFRFKTQLERVPADKLPADRRFNPLSMHPYVLHKALAQAGRYTAEELVRAMELLLECNQRLVSSGLDEAVILQQTLVEIVRGEGALATTAEAALSPSR